MLKAKRTGYPLPACHSNCKLLFATVPQKSHRTSSLPRPHRGSKHLKYKHKDILDQFNACIRGTQHRDLGTLREKGVCKDVQTSARTSFPELWISTIACIYGDFCLKITTKHVGQAYILNRCSLSVL